MDNRSRRIVVLFYISLPFTEFLLTCCGRPIASTAVTVSHCVAAIKQLKSLAWKDEAISV